jgi:hypothetical protein
LTCKRSLVRFQYRPRFPEHCSGKQHAAGVVSGGPLLLYRFPVGYAAGKKFSGKGTQTYCRLHDSRLQRQGYSMDVFLPDGSVKALADRATGFDAAQAISQSLAKEAIAIKVNGVLHDLSAVLPAHAHLEVLTFDSSE